MHFDYLKVPLNKYTFKSTKIREWVEEHCKGKTLNLFAGKTMLQIKDGFEIRNDLDKSIDAKYHMDALELLKKIKDHRFDTVLLDPPYSYRKSMEKYGGRVSSPFNATKDEISRVLKKKGRVITFGYHSVSMGKKRGFETVRLLIMYHGGAIHDTLAIVEDRL